MEVGLGYRVRATAPVRIKGSGLGLGLELGTGSRRRLSLGYWAAASRLDRAAPTARPTMRKTTALRGSEAA